MTKLTVTIITLNEENNIKRCLDSLSFADEIVVIDSHSQDKTKQICANYKNVQFFEHKFDGYGQQKNYAAEQAHNDWIINIDADEVASDKLQAEIKQLNFENNKIYRFKRLTNYCGKWIYHGGWYPSSVARIYNKKYARWTESAVHEELKALNDKNEQIVLNSDLLHYSFPTFKSQVLTNVKYAELGAKDLLNRKQRRPYLFEVLHRPVFKFVECYFIKLGFLDGKEGLIIAINASYSMFMKYCFAYFK